MLPIIPATCDTLTHQKHHTHAIDRLLIDVGNNQITEICSNNFVIVCCKVLKIGEFDKNWILSNLVLTD